VLVGEVGIQEAAIGPENEAVWCHDPGDDGLTESAGGLDHVETLNEGQVEDNTFSGLSEVDGTITATDPYSPLWKLFGTDERPVCSDSDGLALPCPWSGVFTALQAVQH
jgi:hypothetical protein